MDNAFLTERITKTKQQIIAYEDAITALVSNNVQMYSLDTGQSRQSVTKLDINDLQTKLDSLYNRLCTMQARQTGGGVLIASPAW